MTTDTTDIATEAALDPAESARLVRLERTVDRAVEVAGKIAGEALATIRDERLYRLTHRSFEGYVLDRWGFSRATAYRMIDAATVAALPPSEDETAGQPVSPRDTSPSPTSAPGRPDSPFVLPDDEPLPTVDACRVFARVIDTGAGVVGLRMDPDTRDYPEVGQRVLLVWER